MPEPIAVISMVMNCLQHPQFEEMTVGKDSMDEAAAPPIPEWIGRLEGGSTEGGPACSLAQYRSCDLAEIQRLVFTSA
ncbi:hypothetical protein ACF1BQ_016720 [Bradyrhizobium sp. RDT10]